MENRDRDKVSQGTRPTEADDINRDVESRRGIEKNDDSSAEFGQKIGESESSSNMGDERNSRRGETEH